MADLKAWSHGVRKANWKSRKEIVFGLRKQGKIPVFSPLAFASACAKFYETYMIACTAYAIF